MSKVEWHNKAIKLFNEGYSYSKIAKTIGKGRSPVTRYLQSKGYYRNVSDNVKKANKKTTQKLKKFYTCQYCGNQYQKKRQESNKFCSRECYFNSTRKRCETCGKFTGSRDKKYCSECDYSRCLYCGNKTDKAIKKYCDDDCYNSYQRIKWKENAIKDYNKNPNYVTCKECGITRKLEYGEKRRDYCSDKCSKKAHKKTESFKIYKKNYRQKRRSRIKGAKADLINHKEIFERDNWVCQICKLKVNPKLKYPNPKSASLDHIIPLAEGGTHTKNNVQLTHLECNYNKANKPANDQLRFFG